MRTTAVKTPTPPFTKGEQKSTTRPPDSLARSNAFLAVALSMAWQLAIVVLAPIFGGYKLDQAVDTSPVFMVVGFALAAAGMILVTRRNVRQLMPPAEEPKR